MDYVKLRAYVIAKITEAIEARTTIATDYEKKEEFGELCGKIEAYMDVWKYAESLEAGMKEVRE